MRVNAKLVTSVIIMLVIELLPTSPPQTPPPPGAADKNMLLSRSWLVAGVEKSED